MPPQAILPMLFKMIITYYPPFEKGWRGKYHGSRMNRKQDFLKIIVIIAATPATSGDRELIVHAL
jgi:hypothetical protein